MLTMRPAAAQEARQSIHTASCASARRVNLEKALTLNWVHGTLGRVRILDPLVAVIVVVRVVGSSLVGHSSVGRAIGSASLLPLVCMVWPPLILAVALEHARGEAVGRRRQLIAAELGQGGLAAGADDEHLLLAPFALLAGHGRLKTRRARRIDPGVVGGRRGRVGTVAIGVCEREEASGRGCLSGGRRVAAGLVARSEDVLVPWGRGGYLGSGASEVIIADW